MDVDETTNGSVSQVLLLQFYIEISLKNNADIEWNFTKFLLDQNGRVVSRVATDTAMITMTDAIATLL